MDKYPSKGWETVIGLPFDEKIMRIRDADTRGFIVAVSETVHNKEAKLMDGAGEMWMDLPVVDVTGKGDMLHEIVGSRFSSGRLEVSHRRSVMDAQKQEKGREEIVATHFVWGNGTSPEWKRRTVPTDDFKAFKPTKEEEAAFRAKCMEALVRRNERLRRQKVGRKGIETPQIKGNLL